MEIKDGINRVFPLADAAHYTRLRDFGALQADISSLATREVVSVKGDHLADLPTNRVASIPLPTSTNSAFKASRLKRVNMVSVRSDKQTSQVVARKHAGKKYLSVLVRVGLTLILFIVLFRSLSWGSLIALMGNARRALILMGLIIGAAGVVISSYQWRSLLQSELIHFDLADLIDLYLVGTAFSHFLPTGMGGDAVKALYVGRQAGNTEGSASAVVMSRVTGFFSMLAIATLILVTLHAHFAPRLILWFVLLSLLVGGMIFGAILSTTLLPRLFRSKPGVSRLIPGKIRSSIVGVGNALKGSAARPLPLLIAMLFGVLFWITACLNYYSYAIAIGVSVPLYFYFVAIPFISLVTILPISINGFGVRESAFVYLFSTMHVSAPSSLLIVLLMDAQVIFFGVLGGCIYLMLNKKKSMLNLQKEGGISVPQG
ncbi:MAG TPA: lysylphosphatidylglycerol synthase transmembrane domain-containing protein [Ktedonobacteraceae bacterium]|nr:lysylphosphatidylglycerol synthase transmembrane domain-containing protein [Ktedonobacteraceae bacterium]